MRSDIIALAPDRGSGRGGRLDLTLFVAEPVQGRGEPVALVSVEGRIPVEGIRPEDIEPTLEHWGRYLVRRLDRGVRDEGRRTVRIQPLSIRGAGTAQPDELGRELADWLGEALLESRWFDFVEPAPSGSAATMQVDGELLGSATVRDEHVKVSVRVLDNQRRRVTAWGVVRVLDDLSGQPACGTVRDSVPIGGGVTSAHGLIHPLPTAPLVNEGRGPWTKRG